MNTMIQNYTILVGTERGLIYVDKAIIMLRALMFDILPDPVRHLVTFVIIVGLIFAIRNIIRVGGGD